MNLTKLTRVLVTLFAIVPSLSFAQLGVAYHQSNLPFIGVNYEFGEKFRPELRIGTDNFFADTSLELVATYDILNKEEFEVYAGIGGRIESFTGIVVPIGLNIYPHTTKQFGFQIEVAPLIGDSVVLRGSWGIRYRFN